MSSDKAMVFKAADVGESGEFSGAALSEWLGTAMEAAAAREPLLAAEDAIMLVDIVGALSKDTITMATIILNPMIGGWLKKAVIDNRTRPKNEVLRDAEYLRDFLIAKILVQYRADLLPGTDLEIRISNIMNMAWGLGKNILSPWSQQAAAILRAMSNTPDGGASKITDHMEAERADGHEEMADMLHHLSHLPRHEIRGCLLRASEGLSSLAHQLH